MECIRLSVAIACIGFVKGPCLPSATSNQSSASPPGSWRRPSRLELMRLIARGDVAIFAIPNRTIRNRGLVRTFPYEGLPVHSPMNGSPPGPPSPEVSEIPRTALTPPRSLQIPLRDNQESLRRPKEPQEAPVSRKPQDSPPVSSTSNGLGHICEPFLHQHHMFQALPGAGFCGGVDWRCEHSGGERAGISGSLVALA